MELNDIKHINARIAKLEFEVEKQKIKNQFLQKRLNAYQMFIDMHLINNYISNNTVIEENEFNSVISNAKYPICDLDQCGIESIGASIEILFNNKQQPFIYGMENVHFDLACLYGIRPSYEKTRLIIEAQRKNMPIIVIEDGFIRSIVTHKERLIDPKYWVGHSLSVDYCGLYVNANYPSRLENLLNSEFELTEKEYNRAKKLIHMIIGNYISKYNHQPILEPRIGSENRKKVLVIDQKFGDTAIEYGRANHEIFENMLEAAIKENPDADIIVKTHPVTTYSSVNTGYYQNLVCSENVYKVDYDLNPICLLNYVDKVYVCTSQMGFEALLCGKEVHVFGMPFYAGWGITKDRQNCERRRKKRTLEEVFYITYIMYSKYVSYKTNRICEIEDTIKEILELREEYWNTYGMLKETL